MDGFPADIPSTATIQIGCFHAKKQCQKMDCGGKKDVAIVLQCSKINLWCRAQVKKENDEKWSILKMRYAIFQQLREKHPKMDAPNYVCWLYKHKTTLFCDKKLCSSKYCAPSTSK